MRNKYVVIPILVHIFVMVGLLAVVVISGANYRDVLLTGDDYYEIAEGFVHGDTLLYRYRGPIFPLILTSLFIFPVGWHPFVRLLISLIISGGVVIIVYHITKYHITKKQFLIGSLIFVLNPVYIHWIFRCTPEPLLALFLGLFILCTVNFHRANKAIYLIFSALILFFSFFIKPVFLFVPILLLFAALLLKSRRLAFSALLLVIIGVASYGFQYQIVKMRYNSNRIGIGDVYDYKHKIFLITDSFWTDYVLRTKQFRKPTIENYEVEYKDGKGLNEFVDGWLRDFEEQFPNSSLTYLNLYFIRKELVLVLQKLFVSPFFYFAMSARTAETFLKLGFAIVSIVLAVIGLKSVLKTSEHSDEVVIILSIAIGYISLHLVSHAMNRYSLPVLPYLYIWGGIPLAKIADRITRSCSRSNNSTQNDSTV